MKKIIAGMVLLCGLSVPALAADYTVINLTINVNRSAAAVWAKVGGYCAIADWFKAKCAITSGNGEVGTIRRMNDRLDELLVAKSAYSYTYTQPATPNPLFGTLEVRSVDSGHSQIFYTLLYDQAPLGAADAQAAARQSRTTRFQTAIETMKAMAEAN
jgi:Polyketide cyclase / dehydrase and lipid transport